MTDLLTPIEERLDLILRGGRGADGSLGPHAQARSIPADRYRRALDNASLRDLAYPSNAFDRAYFLDWISQGPAEPQYQQACDHALVVFEVELLLGHLYGVEQAAMLRVIGSEIAAVAAQHSRRRMHGDVHRIRRAITFAGLHGNDTDPAIVSIEQRAPTATEDLGDRLLTTLPLAVTLRCSNTAEYLP